MRRQFPCNPLITLSLAAVLFAVVLSAPTRGEELTPVGRWRTIDDKTGKPKGIVEIYEEKGKLFGKIERSLDPKQQNEKCDLCPGDRKNKPVVGLIVLRNMEKHDAEYSGGDILDPDNGKVYGCKMKLIDPNTLQLRGFIGFSLLGRNQTWHREP